MSLGHGADKYLNPWPTASQNGPSPATADPSLTDIYLKK